MNFEFNDEQQQLRAAVRKWVDQLYTFDRRQAIVEQGGFSSDAWREIADLGLSGLQVDEQHGGLGLGSLDAMVVMEEFGRGLVLEPYAQAALMATGVLRSGSSADLREQWLSQIAMGTALVVLAYEEQTSRYCLSRVATRARRSADTWVVDGEKRNVPAGAHAGAYIVSARVTGAEDDLTGIGLFLIERDAQGLQINSTATQDGAATATIRFSTVKARLLSSFESADNDGLQLLQCAVDRGIAALCAEAVGIMEALLTMTVEYMNTRQQFGVALASFQVVRHRLADMKMQLELARSMSYFAALRLDSPCAIRRRAISQAKLQLGQSMRFVGQQAVQLHGGIGLAEEYEVAHYFKRLTVLELTYGDTLHHLAEVAASMDEMLPVYD
jgi:alkylation response protein AidB-like acyl-CoA dehydrogenase